RSRSRRLTPSPSGSETSRSTMSYVRRPSRSSATLTPPATSTPKPSNDSAFCSVVRMEGSSSTTSKWARAIEKKASTLALSPPLESMRRPAPNETEVCYGGTPKMTQPGQPPTAQGSLERTPFVHLLVYLADRLVSGTLVLAEPDQPPGEEHAIYFLEGTA